MVKSFFLQNKKASSHTALSVVISPPLRKEYTCIGIPSQFLRGLFFTFTELKSFLKTRTEHPNKFLKNRKGREKENCMLLKMSRYRNNYHKRSLIKLLLNFMILGIYNERE